MFHYAGLKPQTYLVGHVTKVNTMNGYTRVALDQSTLLYIVYRLSHLFIALSVRDRANRSIWVKERELGLAVLSLPPRSALHASLQNKAISLHMIYFYCTGLYIRFFYGNRNT